MKCRSARQGTAACPSAKMIRQQLKRLLPWRKGPFNLFGVKIDAEWRSDMKWRRLQDKISPLSGRTVLDVGCGNGYYGWRMLGAGAKRVVGTDPTLRYVMQQRAMAKYLPDVPFDILPFTLETLAGNGASPIPAEAGFKGTGPLLTTAGAGPFLQQDGTGFDTVFSMGVNYHRRDPVKHIRDLLMFLRHGGELVLDSLIIDERYGDILKPRDRYARMRNIWSIPSHQHLERLAVRRGTDICRSSRYYRHNPGRATGHGMDVRTVLGRLPGPSKPPPHHRRLPGPATGNRNLQPVNRTNRFVKPID